jgi:hypothetical protein
MSSTDFLFLSEVYKKLWKQGKLSGMLGHVVYHSDDGCRCAIGQFIADEDYTPKLETNSISNMLQTERGEFSTRNGLPELQAAVAKIRDRFPGLSDAALLEAQRMHDSMDFEDFEDCETDEEVTVKFRAYLYGNFMMINDAPGYAFNLPLDPADIVAIKEFVENYRGEAQ